MKAVVDACVAVKWVLDEPYADAARHLAATRALLAPALLHAEVANALSRRARRGEITPDEAVAMMHDIAFSLVDPVPDDFLAPAAVELSCALDHPVYDCFYLALAIAEDTQVVTADRTLMVAAQAGGLGDRVLWIEDVR